VALESVSQGILDPPHEFFAAGEHLDVQVIQRFARNFHPGVLVVKGTMHLRSRKCIASLNLFDCHLDLYVQLALTLTGSAQRKSHTRQEGELASLPAGRITKRGTELSRHIIKPRWWVGFCKPHGIAETKL
jgi:hypothetical protein